MDPLNVDNLLKALDNEEHTNLINTSFQQIAKDKNDILQNLHLQKDKLKDFHKKLRHYRYIDELNDLKYGQYIRWINLNNESLKLTSGGIFLDLKLLNNGTHVVCKNNMNKVFQIKFDECIFFQKISNQEEIILKVLNYVNK
tara:strand:- start:1855 stop:2280 length:426 start_codon:yes stop_codon:yes gene_type:complete